MRGLYRPAGRVRAGAFHRPPRQRHCEPHRPGGQNCRIHEGVCIGATSGGAQAAVIGDNVFIGSGAKIIGPVTIASDVAIGAGAVVVRSITEPGSTWAGVPARKVSDRNSHRNLSPYLHLDD